MDLELPAEYERFRERVRRFVEDDWLSAEARALSRAERVLRVRERNVAEGLVLRGVPKASGGSEVEPDSLELSIIEDEFRRAGVSTTPRHVVIGERTVVPILLAHGTEWQKEHFIPRPLSGEIVWAQGFSEPGSGSDLATLTTRAGLDGTEWVVNGHKIWTTNAATGNYLIALVRTEPDKACHRGLSYLLIDLRSPGVDPRPLRIATGAEHFGEVYLEDVRVPAENLIGARGDGTRLEDPAMQERLLEIEGFVQAHRLSGYRQLSRVAAGKKPGSLSMFNKLSRTSLAERGAPRSRDHGTGNGRCTARG
ncbi:MAG: acyl-CoA dehydrogenase family protein [Phycisphaerales bacterium JB058]